MYKCAEKNENGLQNTINLHNMAQIKARKKKMIQGK